MNIGKFQKLFGVGPFGFILSLLLLGLLHMLNRAIGPLRVLQNPVPFRIIGCILIVVWICWHIWAMRTIRSWWKHDQLCTTGPFRFVRHPIYAGALLLACTGVAMLFNSWMLLSWPVLMFPIWSALVRKEENLMTSIFGDEYRRYAARTGRLFPPCFRVLVKKGLIPGERAAKSQTGHS
jgi:protein-S-isoprenylcysteine O-methyltransferase Ste14